MIQAYKSTHHGVRPAPALVKRLLTSTATDLGHPAYEQGAGQLNSLAAVKAALSWKDGNGAPKAQGTALVVDKTQLSVTGAAGRHRQLDAVDPQRQPQQPDRAGCPPVPSAGSSSNQTGTDDAEHGDRADVHRRASGRSAAM